MKTDEIRRRYLEFFRKRDHSVLPSDSLVPSHDPSLLFTGAGMNQFKDEFYGRGDGTLKRAVTCQKCLRTGDIEKVGKTPSHHTFFEMLGNFSFGDYFKEESIKWAWEFMLTEMDIPQDRMVVSIYEGDEESYLIWKDGIGLPQQKIYRFGEGENFWPPNARTEGPNGPCGPCSEIFYDRGKAYGCGRSDCGPDCECDRFVEVWNLVFQQYDRKEDGSLEELPMRNIDTGMGLERMARVLQDVPTNYDIDVFASLMDEITRLAALSEAPSPSQIHSVRRIADHARAVVFCIADGVIPGNEERGYVVRRLMRRAIRDAVQLGIESAFFARLVDPVVETFCAQYPELSENREHIKTVVAQEEEAFRKTVRRGSVLLDQHIAELKRGRASVLRGKEVFDLYQTYGFPVEMTESIVKEHGISIDMEGFLRHMECHQRRSKEGASFQEAVFGGGPIATLMQKTRPTEFTGYQTLESEAEIIGIIVGQELADSIGQGTAAALVLDRTPAYGEAGGQVGDIGFITASGSAKGTFEFSAVVRQKAFFLHLGEVREGTLSVGDKVVCSVDKAHRRAIARNHTATHLLHYALRQVVGEHARQSGSYVSAHRLRFDFSNPTELSAQELLKVENIVNEKILEDEPVAATRMSRSEAREAGAVALFGEKYGDIVRVISIGDYSRELCGGTHCQRTGEIGLFRITSESSVAGGVRRIEAVTGWNALERLRQKEDAIRQLCDTLGTQEENLANRCGQLLQQIRSLQKEVTKQRQEAVKYMASGSLLEQAKDINGVKLITAKLPGSHAELRSAADVLRKNNSRLVCVLASQEGGKVALVVGISNDLVEAGVSAKDIINQAARVVGGGGGGRPDLAQAGGSNASRLQEAFEAATDFLRNKLAP